MKRLKTYFRVEKAFMPRFKWFLPRLGKYQSLSLCAMCHAIWDVYRQHGKNMPAAEDAELWVDVVVVLAMRRFRVKEAFIQEYLDGIGHVFNSRDTAACQAAECEVWGIAARWLSECEEVGLEHADSPALLSGPPALPSGSPPQPSGSPALPSDSQDVKDVRREEEEEEAQDDDGSEYTELTESEDSMKSEEDVASIKQESEDEEEVIE